MRGQYMVTYLCLEVIAVSAVLAIANSTPLNETYGPVKNFSCITYDYEIYILCSWNVEPSVIDTFNITIYYVWETIERAIQCTERTSTSCKLDMTDLDIDPDLGYLKVCIVRCFTSYYTKQVKPSQVFDIEARTNSSCIEIKWKHGRSVEAWGEQIYRIRVTPELTANQISANTTGKEIRFCNLIPNTKYSVSVSAKPIESGYWSDSVIISATTPPDHPFNPPETCVNCFSVLSDGPSTTIDLYWKNLQKEYWNDHTMKYRLEWKSTCRNQSNIAKRLLASSSPYKIEVPKSCHPFQVSLWSMNSQGMSPVPSYVTVPDPSSLLPAPKALGFLDRGKSQLNVTWETDERNSQTNFTLFWCKKGILLSCTSELNWIDVTGKSSVTISINPSNYMFAVAKEQFGAVTGLQWTDCIIHDSGIPFSPEAEISNSNTEIHIWWHFPRCSAINLKKYLSNFHVSYCYSRGCIDKHTVSVNSSTMEIFIPFNPSQTEACASVRAVLKDPGPESHWICTHKSHLREEHVKISTWILITIIILPACLGILTCIYVYRRYTRKTLDISVPPVYHIGCSSNRKIIETSAASAENENCPMLRTEKGYCNISTNSFRKNKEIHLPDITKDRSSPLILKLSKNNTLTNISTIGVDTEKDYIVFEDSYRSIRPTS